MTNTPEIHVTSYFSPDDGVCVVHIDTPGITENASGPVIRIYLNDEPIEQNPPYPGNALETPDNVHRKILEHLDRFTISDSHYHNEWNRLTQGEGYIPASSYDEAINLLQDLDELFEPIAEEEESVV